MNKDQRHAEINQLVGQAGKMSVNDLADILAVTPETIRRDLDELESNQLITRIHGAAIPYAPEEVEMMFTKKMAVNKKAKQRVAQACCNLIRSGDTIAVDIGTSTLFIGELISGLEDITVITNSLAAAQSFNNAIEDGRMTGQVIVLPGFTNPAQASIKGSYTVDFLKKFHVDKAFISCGGLLQDAVYDFDMEESLVSKTMIDCCDQAILLVDKSKLGVRTLFEVTPLAAIDLVVCDGPAPETWQAPLPEWLEV
ncbi:DeoR/GlpR family DNA-binding transcription regulator [Ignavigranum ruoffiae]|uniref:DNA-binding transcriptional regulator of sugar metabolism, DeoR/GlpR family n=1 Tax=Ignavigranum ruoffiae TaxID=89093 RepID=A0A1H9FF54_9LACT|nr:DeoR/GlpR family DNA-binding transcription regulator [Ignavigranum ruoffiae]UPQ86582.1 DeoR/GlpR family DNA-binding transcription regulator [Ignavigranum ruoffiae]SEQ35928.1 DNA-binding transcriptional regulator of sugar metabolism, DeoR/GlpR family [Ignavigranum ruoffiae]